MRRIRTIFLAFCTLFALVAMSASARGGTWADVHLGGPNRGGLGITKHLAGSVWGGLRMDGLGTSSIHASADVLYKVPKQLWIWEPYAGGGIDCDLATGQTGAHVVVGTKILWFFAEDEFRLIDRGNTARAGIRLAF